MNFNFGADNKDGKKDSFSFGSDSGFTFGAPKQDTNTDTQTTGKRKPEDDQGFRNKSKGAPAFSFGNDANSGSSTQNFDFGESKSFEGGLKTSNSEKTSSQGGLNFGAPTQSATTQSDPKPFSFGGDDKTSQGGFSFGAPTQSATTQSATTGFDFSNGDKTSSQSSKVGSDKGFGFGSDNKTPSTTTEGFSFGSDNKTPSTTTEGFSFGNENKAPSTTKEGFSFGNDNKTSSSQVGFSFDSSSVGKDESKPAGSNDAKKSQVSFSSDNPTTQQVASKPSDGTSSIQNHEFDIHVESLLKKNSTIESIINKWNSELDKDVLEFNKLATQVSKWDQQLLDNEEKLINLNSNYESVKTQQKELGTTLTRVEEDQVELENKLKGLENEFEKYMQTSSLQKTDIERKDIYDLANDIDRRLNQMDSSLNGMVKKLNQAYERNADPTNQLNQIVKVLNSHLHSIQSIDEKCLTFEQSIENLKQKLHV